MSNTLSMLEAVSIKTEEERTMKEALSLLARKHLDKNKFLVSYKVMQRVIHRTRFGSVECSPELKIDYEYNY